MQDVSQHGHKMSPRHARLMYIKLCVLAGMHIAVEKSTIRFTE
jgi:hypothetical protein